MRVAYAEPEFSLCSATRMTGRGGYIVGKSLRTRDSLGAPAVYSPLILHISALQHFFFEKKGHVFFMKFLDFNT